MLCDSLLCLHPVPFPSERVRKGIVLYCNIMSHTADLVYRFEWECCSDSSPSHSLYDMSCPICADMAHQKDVINGSVYCEAIHALNPFPFSYPMIQALAQVTNLESNDAVAVHIMARLCFARGAVVTLFCWHHILQLR